MDYGRRISVSRFPPLACSALLPDNKLSSGFVLASARHRKHKPLSLFPLGSDQSCADMAIASMPFLGGALCIKSRQKNSIRQCIK